MTNLFAAVFELFFSPGLRTHFKNLNNLKSVNYHLYKNPFRLTPKNIGS